MKVGTIATVTFSILYLCWRANCVIHDCSKYTRLRPNSRIYGQKKFFVNCFAKDVESGISDLVVLVDRSGSMWSRASFGGVSMTGYEVAKVFIKSLLSEVRIAYDATRIAVGTFGYDATIDINYILDPTSQNQKCQFNEDLNKKLPSIGGPTNIKGAFDRALEIFKKMDDDPQRHHTRHNANRVVLLLSDGRSNYYNGRWGWIDPTPVVNTLKNQGVIVYTVGVTYSADRYNLQKWASHTSAFLFASSFSHMLALARNIRGGKELYNRLSII